VLKAFVNAGVLLIPMGILGYEVFARLLKAEIVSGGVIAWVAALGIFINGVLAFLFFRQKHEPNSNAAYLHMLTDACVSLGIVIASIVISYTHFYWLDSVISLAILIVILFSTWGLIKDSFKTIINAVSSGIKKVITSILKLQME